MIRAALPLFALVLSGPALAEPILLAAASTGRAVDAALAQSGVSATTSYGASGILARQIEQGAPADLFLSANPKWMSYLVEAGLVDGASVAVLMSNRLVLIAPQGAAPLQADALADRLEGENFVMADPASAPVGTYGKAALETLGLWPAVTPHFVPVRNTLAAVAAVSNGEAALGLVYASDAAGAPGVDVVWDIPEASHPPIRYLIAPVEQGEDPDGGARVLDYLLSDAGGDALGRFGFFPVGEDD